MLIKFVDKLIRVDCVKLLTLEMHLSTYIEYNIDSY